MNIMRFFTPFLALASLATLQAEETPALVIADRLDSQKISATPGEFHGFDQVDFKLPGDGSTCKIVAPKVAASESPWVWRARFFGHQPAFDTAMLEKGYHIAYCDIADLYGSAKAVKRWDKFYDLTQKLGLGSKPVLEGMSRGGLIIFNWAKANPEKVTAIYGDNPVCDIRSWPKKKSAGDWKRCLEAYGITEADDANFKGNPIDSLDPLARARVPVFLVLGAKDNVVPLVENADVLEKNYKALGGYVRRWVKPEGNHHPHGLDPPDELVNAVLNEVGPK